MLSAWLPAPHVLLCGGSSTTKVALASRDRGVLVSGVGTQPEVGSLALSLVQPCLSAGSAALLFLIHI